MGCRAGLCFSAHLEVQRLQHVRTAPLPRGEAGATNPRKPAFSPLRGLLAGKIDWTQPFGSSMHDKEQNRTECVLGLLRLSMLACTVAWTPNRCIPITFYRSLNLIPHWELRLGQSGLQPQLRQVAPGARAYFRLSDLNSTANARRTDATVPAPGWGGARRPAPGGGSIPAAQRHCSTQHQVNATAGICRGVQARL